MKLNRDRLVYECVVGSNAYGTNIPTSDRDIKGIYIDDFERRVLGNLGKGESTDGTEDVKYYEIGKLFSLLRTCNPTVLELLYMPEECILYKHDSVMDLLFENRHLFVSKKAFFSFSGYAVAQIKKAKGKNKKVNNPQPKERPKKEDFCWVITDFKGHAFVGPDGLLDIDNSRFPMRPVPLNETKIDLSQCHVASLEHVHNAYRIYAYPMSKAKGVFRGDEMLVCESIPDQDEFDLFIGLLIYNQEAYEKAVREWKSYWTWMDERNDARWLDQEKGKLQYDAKNMMHCVRLLMSGENILKHGEPVIRFEKEKLDFLRDIRAGKFEYEYLMDFVDNKMKDMEVLFEKSDLPEDSDKELTDRLLIKALKEFECCSF